jgi:hypothetical protein
MTLKLRKFTVLSHRNLIKLGVTLFTEGTENLDQAGLTEQILALVWERSTPVEEVLDAIENGTAWRKILASGEAFELEQYADLVAEVNRVGEALKSKTVEVVARPGAEDKDAPGN